MRSLEDVFVRELKNSITTGYKDIYRLPYPKECSEWSVSGTELYAVKGADGHYSALNKTIVKRLPRGYDAKRRTIDKVTRSFKKDKEGNYVYEEYKVPSGSVVVTSEVDIELPYSMYLKEVNGYGYIDFVTIGGKVEYLYVLPKSVLYKVNQTALVVSVKNMKNFSGMGYVTWKHGTIFLHVIPYNPNAKYVGSKVLKTGYTLDYLQDFKIITDYWQKVGIMPNIDLCALQSGENLCLKPTNVGYDSYIPVEQLSLNDRVVFGEEGETY